MYVFYVCTVCVMCTVCAMCLYVIMLCVCVNKLCHIVLYFLIFVIAVPVSKKGNSGSCDRFRLSKWPPLQVCTQTISHTDPYPATCLVTHSFGCDIIFSIVYFIAASFSLARLSVSIAN